MGARSSKVEPSETAAAQPVSTISVVAIALRRALNRTRDLAKLEFLPDKHGAQLQLSERQQRLIQLQHPGATRVVVKKLHGGFSGSLVLQTAAYDVAGRPEEPAVTKLDKAAALANEIDKQDAISGELGPFAIRILRRPLYLGERGGASGQYTASMHAKDADAAVVLELAGACWVLPEFFGKVANEQDIIVPFKQHLQEALESGVDRKNIEGVFDDLYAVGGPLQRLACKATLGAAATAKEGFLATALEEICREVARSMVPAQDAGDAAQAGSAYAVPAPLLKAAARAGPLAPSGEVTKRKECFQLSFVHECGEQVWGDAACAPLIALAKELRAQLQNGASWLSGWRPLQLLQHGDLNAANVLIDARGAIWLIDFAETGTHEAFCDAAKLISVQLFEYLPCDDEEMLRRGCAVVDALIPTNKARQLWEEPSTLSEQDWSATHILALSLAAKVKAAACNLIISTSRRDGQGGEAAADVHPAALWLPLLREALRCLRYRDLSIWQKRTAWHAARRLSMALLEALPREPVSPPERRADEVASLKLAQGQLLQLTAEAARREGAPPADCYEVMNGGLYRFPDRTLLVEPSIVVHCTAVTFDDICHEVGTVLPGADSSNALRRSAAELVESRERQAAEGLEAAVENELAKEKERRQASKLTPLTEEDGKRFKEELAPRLKRENVEALLSEASREWAIAELRKTGVIEQRRYAPEQQLSVLEGDRWRDMTVISVQDDGLHRLSAADSSDRAVERCLVLHALNHAPLELSEAAFQIQQGKHAHRMSVKHASIRDALSGRPLTSLQQCVPIAITDGQQSRSYGAALASINDVRSLCHWLHDAHSRRQCGERGTLAAVLLTAPPAAGKTCLISQLVMHTLGQPEPLVPLVIKVMDLQQVLLLPEHKAPFASKWNWADAYCCATLGEASPSYRFLRQALLARRALLLLDGMDEGGQGKRQIEQHVKEVLLPQGHPMLLTSRPDSLVPEVYKGCAHLQLLPLTENQQRIVIAGRLSGSSVQELAAYVQRLPPDTDGSRLTGNPLMLNMLISIYESRQLGVSGRGGMPEKLQQVYELASGVMLDRLDLKQRGGSTKTNTEQLRRLLREVALDAHLREQRQIRAETLELAAARLGVSGQRIFETMAEQLALDRMPMLSVIQHKPLVVQFSHLSFQEYFAARAICAIQSQRKGVEPWRWAPWWGNAVRLGADCGKPFGLGLLRATGLEGIDTLDLHGKLKKGSMAAVAAVVEVIKASGSLTDLNMSKNAINVGACMALAVGLKGNTSLKKINVLNSLDDGADALVAAAREMPQLTTLCGLQHEQTDINFSQRGLGVGDAKLLAFDLSKNPAIKTLNMSSNALCGIYLKYGKDGHQMGTYNAEGITALCEGLKGSAVASLNLKDNFLGSKGASSFAKGLKGNTTLTSLNMSSNALCDIYLKYGNNGHQMGTYNADGITALCEGLKGSAVASLNIKGNRIGDKGMLAIGKALLGGAASSLCALECDAFHVPPGATNLDLSRKKLGAAAATLLAGVIKGNTSISTLNVANNHLGVEGGMAVAAMLYDTQITTLDLANNSICCGVTTDRRGEQQGIYTTEVIKKLCEGLKDSSVTSLNLCRNKLGNKGWTKVFKALCENKGDKIEAWDLSEEGISPETAKALAEYTSVSSALKSINADGHTLRIDVLKGTKPIERINLSNKKLGVASAFVIAACIKENGVLKELNLRGNKLTVDGGKAVAAVLKDTQITNLDVDGHVLPIDVLKGTKPTEMIDLSNKKLGVASACIIAACIKENGVLKELNLWFNQLGPEGGAAIAEGLKGNTTLKELNMRENYIGVEGGKAVAAVLKDTKITNLNLNQNALGPEGGVAIAEALKGNATLEELDIASNGLNPGFNGHVVLKLAEVLQHTKLTRLNLLGNGLGEAKGILQTAAGSSVRLSI